MITFLQIIHILICLLFIGVILMQSGKGQGLSGAFGSFAGGAAQNVFGARTGDALTKITTGLAIAFFVSAIFAGIIQSRSSTTVLKNYKAPISETPTHTADLAKDKLAELTNLLKKSEKKSDGLPTSLGVTPTPSSASSSAASSPAAPTSTPAVEVTPQVTKTPSNTPAVVAVPEAKPTAKADSKK